MRLVRVLAQNPKPEPVAEGGNGVGDGSDEVSYKSLVVIAAISAAAS